DARMDFDQLAAFERIAREGSFSRAALAIGIGQPAASARIPALEAALGGALFTRGRRISLTPLGEGFLPFARRLLETLDEGVQAAVVAARTPWPDHSWRARFAGRRPRGPGV